MLVAGEPRQAILRGTELDSGLKRRERMRLENGTSAVKAEPHRAGNPAFEHAAAASAARVRVKPEQMQSLHGK
jgi:hypothetical protein